MEQTQCKICNQVIEGFTHKDLKYKMLMHSIKHRKKEKEENTKENEATD
jgi:hypothetical protein